jgi:beta-glucosidase
MLIKLIFVVGASLALGSVSARAAEYPRDFVWGAALSAHQTEGAWGGAENGDWWQFEHSLVNGRSPIAGGDTTEVAVDHWHRYAEDFALASQMGLRSVRISLAWEKIEPRPGKFDEAVLEHYRDVLQSMRAQGIQPVVALHHFTHPTWFHSQGSWVQADSPQLFLAYATKVVERLGDLCDTWITFNEPMVQVFLGYVQGTYPPNHHSIKEAIPVAVNLARAHRLVTAMIHDRQPGVPHDHGIRGVGLVNSLQLYEASRAWNPVEQLSVRVIETVSNWAFPALAIDGEIPLADRALIALVGGPLSLKFPKDEAKGQPVADWFGVNYYTRYFIRAKFPIGFRVLDPKDPPGDNGWGVYPQGLEKIVRQTARRVHLPLVVSENGMADATDHLRPEMIRETLSYLDRLVVGAPGEPALDVRGYFHWSLTDNFEWLSGYKFRFGLVEILYDQDLKRVPRDSARVYAGEIRARQTP